jgi:hypothetical protein
MTFVYIAGGVIIALIIGGFAIFHWTQQRALDAAVATPTPAPAQSGAAPTPTPIALVDGTTIGKPMIKGGKTLPDTLKGGQGQTIDGISCAGMEFAALHIHPHLSIFYNGQQVAIPRLIGAAPVGPQGCLYWLHTHDSSGILHIEAPQLTPPGGSAYTLGMFFDIWGQPLTRENVAGLRGPVTAYVNGEPYDGDLASIPLKAHELITLEVGKPLVTPPNYVFPPAE